MNVCIYLGYILILMKINRENMIDCMCLLVYYSFNVIMCGFGRGGGYKFFCKI